MNKIQEAELFGLRNDVQKLLNENDTLQNRMTSMQGELMYMLKMKLDEQSSTASHATVQQIALQIEQLTAAAALPGLFTGQSRSLPTGHQPNKLSEAVGRNRLASGGSIGMGIGIGDLGINSMGMGGSDTPREEEGEGGGGGLFTPSGQLNTNFYYFRILLFNFHRVFIVLMSFILIIIIIVVTTTIYVEFLIKRLNLFLLYL